LPVVSRSRRAALRRDDAEDGAEHVDDGGAGAQRAAGRPVM
jgi:hypothetical protein